MNQSKYLIAAMIALLMFNVPTQSTQTTTVQERPIQTTTQTTTQVTSQAQGVNPSEFASKANQLAEKIAKAKDNAEIDTLMKAFVKENAEGVMYVYYGSEKKSFMITPYTEIPADYDYHSRPWYKEARVKGMHLTECYVDAVSNLYIQTVSCEVTSNGKVMGVLGIDYFVNDLDYVKVVNQNAQTELKDIQVGKQEITVNVEIKQNMMDALSKEIAGSKSSDMIMKALEKEVKQKQGKIMYAYYGTAKGKMYLFPKEDLPTDYDPRTRPWYLESKNNQSYLSEPYIDSVDGRTIQTMARAIYVKGKLTGVVGVDYYVDGK